MIRRRFITSGIGAATGLWLPPLAIAEDGAFNGIPASALERQKVYGIGGAASEVLASTSTDPKHLRPGLLSSRVRLNQHVPTMAMVQPPEKFPKNPPLLISNTNNAAGNVARNTYHLSIEHGWLVVDANVAGELLPDLLKHLHAETAYDKQRIHVFTAGTQVDSTLATMAKARLRAAALVLGTIHDYRANAVNEGPFSTDLLVGICRRPDGLSGSARFAKMVMVHKAVNANRQAMVLFKHAHEDLTTLCSLMMTLATVNALKKRRLTGNFQLQLDHAIGYAIAQTIPTGDQRSWINGYLISRQLTAAARGTSYEKDLAALTREIVADPLSESELRDFREWRRVQTGTRLTQLKPMIQHIDKFLKTANKKTTAAAQARLILRDVGSHCHLLRRDTERRLYPKIEEAQKLASSLARQHR